MIIPVIELLRKLLFAFLVQGTVVEGTIQQLFEGHAMNYIECINVDYKSTRKESFYGKDYEFVGLHISRDLAHAN